MFGSRKSIKCIFPNHLDFEKLVVGSSGWRRRWKFVEVLDQSNSPIFQCPLQKSVNLPKYIDNIRCKICTLKNFGVCSSPTRHYHKRDGEYITILEKVNFELDSLLDSFFPGRNFRSETITSNILKIDYFTVCMIKICHENHLDIKEFSEVFVEKLREQNKIFSSVSINSKYTIELCLKDEFILNEALNLIPLSYPVEEVSSNVHLKRFSASGTQFLYKIYVGSLNDPLTVLDIRILLLAKIFSRIIQFRHQVASIILDNSNPNGNTSNGSSSFQYSSNDNNNMKIFKKNKQKLLNFNLDIYDLFYTEEKHIPSTSQQQQQRQQQQQQQQTHKELPHKEVHFEKYKTKTLRRTGNIAINSGNQEVAFDEVWSSFRKRVKPALKTVESIGRAVRLVQTIESNSSEERMFEPVRKPTDEKLTTFEETDLERIAYECFKYSLISFETSKVPPLMTDQSILSLKGKHAFFYITYVYSLFRTIELTAQKNGIEVDADSLIRNLDNWKSECTKKMDRKEKELLLKITQMHDSIQHAFYNYDPHYIHSYTYQLSQKFVDFYQSCRIIGSRRETFRLQLCIVTEKILDRMLNILDLKPIRVY